MILLDFSQIIFSSAIEYNSQTRTPITMDLLRHICLRNILLYKKKFKSDLKDFIICLDARTYWRRDIFPSYKQNRIMGREKSKFDWKTFFEQFNQMKTELKGQLPFCTIEVSKCEADDVIAVLAQENCDEDQEIIIISSDNDFLQLQKTCSSLKQYSPKINGFIDDKGYDLFTHVVKGDTGDGIPNIISDDDVFFVEHKRSRPLRKNMVDEWAIYGLDNPEMFCQNEETLARFKRNRLLIDLSQIPEDIKKCILDAYYSYERKKNLDTFAYLVKHKLNRIIEMNAF